MISKSIAETENLAEVFAKELITKGTSKKALVIGLYGDLGAGKTAFSKALATAFGINETVSSPTFVIEKIYEIENFSWKKLIHIDAYRLKSGEELKKLGFDREIIDKENIILIEWAERIEEILPKDTIRINFTHVSENERDIVVSYS